MQILFLNAQNMSLVCVLPTYFAIFLTVLHPNSVVCYNKEIKEDYLIASQNITDE